VLTLGNPAAIEALAVSLDRRAEELSGLARRLSQQGQAMRWACAKADRFRHDLGQRQTKADQLGNELRAIARDLRALAARVRADVDFLAKLEGQVRDLISTLVPDVRPPWEGTAWNPANLPGPGDPAWREVAKALGISKGR
jgi:uncharacterized protein YukE